MNTRVTRLSRLSRIKTTGNLIISFALIAGSAFIINGLISGSTTTFDKFIVVLGVLFCLIFSYIVNKRLRQPFFSEYSKYFDELGERRLKIQKTAVLVDLIEPLQPLSVLNTVLSQLEELHMEMESLTRNSTSELTLNSLATRTQQIQNILQAIIKFSESTMERIEEKRKKMIYLAKIRKIVFNSIKQHLSRPKNKIETEYLQYKVEKKLTDRNQVIDNHLVLQILNHALDQGEILGHLEQDNRGERLLSIDSIPERTEDTQRASSWHTTRQSEVQCIICRHTINRSESSVSCPNCNNLFHHSHLLEWLKVFGHCPICHQRISIFSNSS
ncbi:MAG: hypothetical protein ACW964_09180 [Candidatus Hodarchaeales archaeon]|jgi:hypothetical protein